MWVKYELIWMGCSPPNERFLFSEIFPIVIPIVIQNAVQRLKIQDINYFFWDSGPYDSLTSLCQRAAYMVECCENQGTLMAKSLLIGLAKAKLFWKLQLQAIPED